MKISHEKHGEFKPNRPQAEATSTYRTGKGGEINVSKSLFEELIDSKNWKVTTVTESKSIAEVVKEVENAPKCDICGSLKNVSNTWDGQILCEECENRIERTKRGEVSEEARETESRYCIEDDPYDN